MVKTIQMADHALRSETAVGKKRVSSSVGFVCQWSEPAPMRTADTKLMKERPNHKSWWQMKKGWPNPASKQLTPNERNKTAETTSKTQTMAYLQRKGGKNITESQQSNRLLSANKWVDDYIDFICCSHKSTEITVPTNRWKAKLTITIEK